MSSVPADREYRSMFDSSKDCLVLAGPGGEILDANPAARRILGGSREALAACGSMFDPADERLAAALQRIRATGMFEGVLSLRKAGGETFDAGVSVSGFRGEGGEERLSVSFRKSGTPDSENRENGTLDRLASFPWLSPHPIIEVNGAGEPTYLNPAAEYRFPDLTTLGSRHPMLADLGPVTRNLKGAGAVTVREVGVGRNFYHQVIRPAPGGILRIYATEITRRHRRKAALRESEERFLSLVRHVSDMTSVLDAEGVISYESPAVERILGVTPQERIKTRIFDHVHPEDKGPVQNILRELWDRPGSRRTFEYRMRDREGSWRHFEAVGSNLLEDPAVKGIVLNSRDVTERRQVDESLRRSLDVLLALHEAGQILGSTLEAEEIGDRLLGIMQRISSLTTAVVSLPDGMPDGRGELRVWRAIGFESLWRRARYTPEARATLYAVLETGERRTFRLEPPDPDERPLVAMCLPLRMRDRVLGVLEIYGPDSLREEDTVGILESLTGQAASALENARLYRELTEREHRLQDLVGRLIQTQEEERRRVSYDVHDGLAQVAAAAHQHLQAFARRYPPDSEKSRQDLGRALDLVQQTVGEARRIIAALRPTALDDFGLTAAISLEVKGLKDDGWQVEYSEDIREERLPFAVETALFRVAQEALRNARKHANTNQLRIELHHEPEKVCLSVRDRGSGFNPAALESGGPGERVGLSGMQERIGMLGGKLRIRSWPGAGTLISAEVPLPAFSAASPGEPDGPLDESRP